MIKFVLFDADELVVKREMYFNERLLRDYDIPIEKTVLFFRNEYKLCAVGKADLKEELKKCIDVWGWKKSVDELINYWFSGERELDKKVVESINVLRNNGIKCCLITNNEKYRTEYLIQEVGLGKIFDDVFSSSRIGHLKSERIFWEKVLKRLGSIQKNEIFVWDSEEKNAETARNFGLAAKLYKGHDSFEKEMKNIFPGINF